jgi:putative SOS response-associated peptidase YedK
MCGRITLRTPAAQLIEMFLCTSVPELLPRYNIAPTQLVICIRSVRDQPLQREAVFMRWGLIPSWAKDMSIASQTINARSETVAEKPSFRSAFAKRRCLIPIDGFYEWQKLSNGKKQPWLMESKDHTPLALAGLWETWSPRNGPASGFHVGGTPAGRGVDAVISCTILTTSANEEMKPLHDRMPVILPPEAWSTWLSDDAKPAQLQHLLVPAPAGSLRQTCVSTVVNRPVVDSPECVTPVDPPEPLISLE